MRVNNMQSLNSFAFNDIDGVRRTFIEGMPNPFSNVELAQLAKDWGGTVQLRAGAVDQSKVDAYIQNKLGEKYDALYQDDFEKAMIEADKEFQEFKTPKQQAEPKVKRKAGSKEFVAALSKAIPLDDNSLTELLQPWENVNRTGMSPDHIGYNEETWYNRNAETRGNLIDMKQRGASIGDLDEYLATRGFTSASQRNNVIKDMYKRVLVTEDVGTPYNMADEDLAMAVLEGSGFQPVRTGNDLDEQATDIEAFTHGGKRKLGVDAQSRTRRNKALTLGMLFNAPDDFVSSFADSGEKLRVALQKLQGTDAYEDKFLHYAGNPLDMGRFNEDIRGKDILISSRRPGQGRQFGSRKSRPGPYDRTRPEGWDLVDLRDLRNDLLNKTASQIQDDLGIDIEEYKNEGKTKVKLAIPNKQIIDRYSNRGELILDPSIVKRLSRRM